MPKSIKQALAQMLNWKLEDKREGCDSGKLRGCGEQVKVTQTELGCAVKEKAEYSNLMRSLSSIAAIKKFVVTDLRGLFESASYSCQS